MDKIKNYSISIIIVSLLFAGCSIIKPFDLQEIKGNTMGTYYVVKYNKHESSESSVEKVKLAIDTELRIINYIMSTYILDSELSLLNAKAPYKKIKLSDELASVIGRSFEISKQSDGAFDTTVGPLVNLWGFGPNKERKVPSESQIKNLLNYVGYQKIELLPNEKSLLKKSSKAYIDLSAIAKGYGVDRVGKFLKTKFQIENLMVEIGGEIRTWGKKGDRDWLIGVEDPTAGNDRKVTRILNISNKSVATSGNYRNYFKYGEKVFSHTINPKTGKPVNHRLLSATVVADTCMDADAYATTLMVMGPAKGLEFSEKYKLKSYLIFEEDGKLLYKMSSEFKKIFQVKK